MLTSERLPRSWSTSATSSVSTTSWLDPLCSSMTTSSLSRAATDPTNLQYVYFYSVNVKCDIMTFNKLSPSLCAYFGIILIDKKNFVHIDFERMSIYNFSYFSFQDKTPTEPNPEVCPCVNQGCYN